MFTPWRAHNIIEHTCVQCGNAVRPELADGPAYSRDDMHGNTMWLTVKPMGVCILCTEKP